MTAIGIILLVISVLYALQLVAGAFCYAIAMLDDNSGNKDLLVSFLLALIPLFLFCVILYVTISISKKSRTKKLESHCESGSTPGEEAK